MNTHPAQNVSYTQNNIDRQLQSRSADTANAKAVFFHNKISELNYIKTPQKQGDIMFKIKRCCIHACLMVVFQSFAQRTSREK